MMTKIINKNRAKRRGPIPLVDPRIHCVSTRLNDAELDQLDRQRGLMDRGEYLRCAAIDQLPPVIPEINQAAWLDLGQAMVNLNLLAQAHNIDTTHISWMSLTTTLNEFRRSLIGAKLP